MPLSALTQVTHAPRCGIGLQVNRQVSVVRTSKCIELLGAGAHIEHVREIGHGAERIGKGLRLLHELGVFDLVQRAAAVGQLHARLQLAVTRAGLRRFPLR